MNQPFNYLFSYLLVFPFCAYSQSTEQQIISSSGNHYENGNAQLSFTIGELIITTESNATHSLTQGFQQTNWNFVGLEDHAPTIIINVFPNPLTDQINIKTDDFEGMSYNLYDTNGKLIFEGKLEKSVTQVDTQNINPASYSLVIKGKEQENLKTFKLIKTL